MTYCASKRVKKSVTSTQALDRVRRKIAILEKELEKPFKPNIRPLFLEQEYQVPMMCKGLRVRSNLSQNELAERMGISQSIIMRIECGKTNVSYDVLHRLAKACARRVVILFERSDRERCFVGLKKPTVRINRLRHLATRGSAVLYNKPLCIEEDGDIAGVFADLRLGGHLSQRELSELTGISQGTIVRIEGGRCRPSSDMMFRLAKACGRRLIIVFE